jgi:hypothetical protein
VHHTARAAPWCPELDEHRRVAAKDEVIPGRLCYIQHCKKEEWLAMCPCQVSVITAAKRFALNAN